MTTQARTRRESRQQTPYRNHVTSDSADVSDTDNPRSAFEKPLPADREKTEPGEGQKTQLTYPSEREQSVFVPARTVAVRDSDLRTRISSVSVNPVARVTYP